MVNLSVNKINAVSPYKVEPIRNSGCVVFKTDFGVEYIVGFDLTEVLVCAETYQFYITNVNNRKSLSDPKLRETIIAVISDFFESSNTAMLYICDTGDGRQEMRSRLFKHWIVDCPLYDNMATLSGSVIDEDGVKNFATIVVRNDHPKLDDILKEFKIAIQTLNNKPES